MTHKRSHGIGIRACAIAGILLIASGAAPSKSARHKAPGDGGLATRAEVDGPAVIAVDGSEALYIGQLSCQRLGKPGVIRRVDLRTGTIASVFTQEPLGIISSLALDLSGDLIVLEMERARRVSLRDGAVRDVAGAELSSPLGVAVDRAGNVYIADTSHHRIRRVDALTGIITAVAGNGQIGWSGDGGPATQASLEYPDSVAVGADGDLFLSQHGYTPGSGCIRRVDGRTGIIETIAGRGASPLTGADAPAREVRLESPHGVILDRDGNPLFIASGFVCRLDLRTGILHTIAGTLKGSGEDGDQATRVKLYKPSSLALDSDGNLFIAEYMSNRVRRVDARTSVITTVAGNGYPHCVYISM
jgi:DNA-binding beta-propeller fold protein YncE